VHLAALNFSKILVRSFAALAILVISTIGTSIFLSHHLMVMMEKNLTEHRQMALASKELVGLVDNIVAIATPANDVFENKNPTSMEEVQKQVDEAYRLQLKQSLKELSLLADERFVNRILDLQVHRQDLAQKSAEVFEYFKRGNIDQAASSMANMDQAYAILNRGSLSVLAEMETHRLNMVREEINEAQDIQNIESIVGVISGILTMFIFVYGLWMGTSSKKMQLSHELAEKERNHHQALVGAILESAADAIITIDKLGRVIQCNQAVRKMLGYESQDLLSQNIKTIMPMAYAQEHDAHLANYIRTKKASIIGSVREVEAQAKTGEIIPVELSVNVVKKSEQEFYFVGIIRDIRERKEYERALLLSQKRAEEAVQSKAQFLANMSHEIRTPMNGILGASNLLYEALEDEEQKELGTMITRSASSLLVIINDILDFSKIEAGKLHLENIPLSFSQILKDVVNLLRGQAEGKGLAMLMDISLDLPPSVLGDPTRIRQILLNLGSNAVKFTHQGSVMFRVKCRQRGEAKWGITLEVIDTGIGMTPVQLNNIFESFSQADESTSRKYGGTGLGKTISKRLVEMMGGRLWAESETGKGSTFIFDLEMAESHQQPESPEAPPPQRKKYSGTILLAEDHPINRKIAVKNLEKLGFKVIQAVNGHEAVDMALHDAHDLILMDIQMPEMNGMEATLELRGRGYAKPIIAMTANVMEKDVQKYLALGMQGHIPKPFQTKDITDVLDKVLGG
jgi:PAS domain S-box-containing protein